MALADTGAWIAAAAGLAGAAIGFAASWLVHRSERAERITERSRTEKKEAYAALLTKSEDCMHLFQWLAERLARERRLSPEHDSNADDAELEWRNADRFYDQEVTPRYRVLRIIGPKEVVDAAKAMKDALNDVRHHMERRPMPDEFDPRFRELHNLYRDKRDEFSDKARVDLGLPPW